jgi:quercetin dioxygenase-like cupin family protein
VQLAAFGVSRVPAAAACRSGDGGGVRLQADHSEVIMLKRICLVVIPLAMVSASAAGAQGVRNLTPGPSHTKAITPVDRPEIKVQRVEIEPNATRGMHAHDDVVYHIFLTMDAPLTLTIQGEAEPVQLGPWQSHYFKGGTVHAITNTSAMPVSFLEIFVNKTENKTAQAAIDPAQAIALAMAHAAR